MIKLCAAILGCAFVVGGCVSQQPPEADDGVAAAGDIDTYGAGLPGVFVASFKTLPVLAPKATICEDMDGLAATVTINGCKEETTNSNCHYDKPSQNCTCDSVTTRSGTCN